MIEATVIAIAIAVTIIVILWAGARLFLLAPDHSEYDEPLPLPMGSRTEASPENGEVLRRFEALIPGIRGKSFLERLRALRIALDEGIIGAPVSADELGVSVRKVSASDVPGEWVLAPDANPARRLLYIHGGGFIAGSPVSTRMITANLSKTLGIAVLSIDYRLAPENRRIHSIRDSQNAYLWLLANGPEGVADADEIYVAGDSAGGNLALMLSAWTRDAGVRNMDAVIAFAPSTDATLMGPSFRSNIKTDPLLGPPLRPLIRLPSWIRALLVLVISQVNPRNPLVSPLFGDLSNLPPTLVQSSDIECLSDDARRYVNKAVASGTRAELQVWPGMLHVFQMYGHLLPETAEAFQSVSEFVSRISAGKRTSDSQADRDQTSGRLGYSESVQSA